MRDHRRAAAQDGVAGQHRPLRGSTNDSESEVWPGVADDVHLQPVDRDDVAVVEALVAEPVLRVERADPAADPLGERRGRLGVVEVPVGQEHDGHVAGDRRDRVEVRVV